MPNALITGATQGIGKAIAMALAEAGADIIGVSASLETTGSAVQQEVEAAGRKIRMPAMESSTWIRRGDQWKCVAHTESLQASGT